MITTFENICVLKNYFIVLRPIFDTTYKGKNRSKYTCEIYITNCSYSNKIGIVFLTTRELYQRGHLGMYHVKKAYYCNHLGHDCFVDHLDSLIHPSWHICYFCSIDFSLYFLFDYFVPNNNDLLGQQFFEMIPCVHIRLHKKPDMS